jgi:hypothetical protein
LSGIQVARRERPVDVSEARLKLLPLLRDLPLNAGNGAASDPALDALEIARVALDGVEDVVPRARQDRLCRSPRR